ncbi:hypothetical protein B0H34DRAFT_794286 [Crassisporium funariophilum]|nr:hypothetical protein B0H34DRAFT_794286 [Crassisporium funariophilum]
MSWDSATTSLTSFPPPFRDTKTPTTKPASRRSSLLLRPSNGVGGGSRETVRRLRGRSRLALDRRLMVGEAGRVGCGRRTAPTPALSQGEVPSGQELHKCPDDDKEHTIPTPPLILRLPRSAQTIYHSCQTQEPHEVDATMPIALVRRRGRPSQDFPAHTLSFLDYTSHKTLTTPHTPLRRQSLHSEISPHLQPNHPPKSDLINENLAPMNPDVFEEGAIG